MHAFNPQSKVNKIKQIHKEIIIAYSMFTALPKVEIYSETIHKHI